MAQIKRRKVIAGLKSKKFVPIRDKKNDLWYMLTVNGEVEPRVKTFMSRGSKSTDITTSRIHDMVKELKMKDRDQFFDYIKCDYKYKAYIADLRRNNHI